MSNDLYNEKLNWFKRNEKPEAVLLVADNPDLVKKICLDKPGYEAHRYTCGTSKRF